jgi:hypothetical protein
MRLFCQANQVLIYTKIHKPGFVIYIRLYICHKH